MDPARIAERLMGMDDAAWARHANPWSVYSRMSAVPLILLAAWSRVWIGDWWWALLALVIGWVVVNPRLFPPPARIDSWASKVTLGERLWLNRRRAPVPPRHRRLPHLLNVFSLLGLGPMIYGLWVLEPWPAVLGGAVVMLTKLWFADRMVWLHEDMRG